MYQESDYTEIREQIRRRSLILLFFVVLLLVPAIVGIVAHFGRNTSLHWLTYASLLLLGTLLLFVDGMFIMPLRAYKRHLHTALYGRTATLSGQFKTLDHTVCVRDNVSFYPLIANVGDLSSEEDDRLFYIDVLKPRPTFEPGDPVTIVSYDKNITSIA